MSFRDWTQKKKQQTGSPSSAAGQTGTRVAAPQSSSVLRDDTPSDFAEWTRKKSGDAMWRSEEIGFDRWMENLGNFSKQLSEDYSSSTMTSADMSKRMDELRELRDAAEKERNKARTIMVGSRYMTSDMREEQQAILEQAEADYGRYNQEYNDLLNRYYQTENEEQRASLQQDEAMSGQYQSAQDIQADMDKVTAVMVYTTAHSGDAAQVEEYKQYLFDKYGLDQQAIDQYVISGTGGAYVPRTDGGYNTIYDLYLELQEKKENAVSTLSEGGYDYERMTGYEDMLVDAAQYQEDMGEWQEYAREHPILSSVDTLLTAPFQGFDFLRVMGQNIGHSDSDDPENYVPMNSYDMDTTNYVNAVRQTVSEEIEEATNWEIFDQNVAAFLYQTGMSIGDSSLNLLAFGPTGALVVGSSTAAANQAKDIIDRGGSKEQAFMGGMAAGAFEAIFEKVSIDNLLATKSVTGWKSWLKETAKQAGIEASEETFTEIANILADAAIMGDNSNFDVAVAEYVAQGMSQEDAERQAFFDLIGQVVQAGVGGVISGYVMGGVVNGVNGMENAAYNRYNQQLVQDNDVKNTPFLETNPQEGPVQFQNEGGIDSSIPEATRQAVEMLVRGEEISGNQAARIARDEDAVALLAQLTGEEINTDAPISRVKSDIRALARRSAGTSAGMEAAVNMLANGEEGTASRVDTSSDVWNATPLTAQVQNMGDMERMAAHSQVLGPVGREAASALYDGSTDPIAYYQGYMQAYNAGLNNKRGEIPSVLTRTQYNDAFRAGRLDAKSGNRGGGLVRNEAASRLSDAAAIDALARKLGVSVVAEETISGPDGRPGGANGYIKDGVIHIALDAKDPAMVVFKHEVTHLLQQRNAKSYLRFRDYAVQVMGQAEVERIQALYRENGMELSWEGAMDEVAANFTEHLLTDEAAVRLLIQDDRSLAQKLFDTIRDLARQLTGKEGAQLRKAEKMWSRMFEEVASQNNPARGTIGKRYSAKEGMENGREGTEQAAEGGVQQNYARATQGDRRAAGKSRGNGTILSRRGMSQGQRPVHQWAEEGLIVPEPGSVSESEAHVVSDEYQLPVFVVKSSIFNQNHKSAPAFSSNGQVFLREDLPEAGRGDIGAHEAGHVMKQIGYRPYLEFIERTPVHLDGTSTVAKMLMEGAAEHIGIDLFGMSDQDIVNLYDEINNMVYGAIHAGKTEVLDLVRPAFYDFDAYAAELSSIHEQFKKERNGEPRFSLEQKPGQDADQRLRARGFTDAAGDARTAVRYSLPQTDGRKMPVLANMPYATLASVSEHLDLLDQAKRGNHAAARKLIASTLKTDLLEQVSRFWEGAYLTPVQGSDGKNVLPLELAQAISKHTKNPLFTQVYQQTHRSMKGQGDSWARLLNPVFFDFEGERPHLSGRHFLLVDDVISSGSTLLSLAHTLEQAGGVVDGYVSLARGRFVADEMAMSDDLRQKIQQQIGGAMVTDFLSQHLGYAVSLDHLTEKQGRAILAHKHDIRAWAQTAQQLHGRDTSTARYSISGQKYWRPKLTKQEWSLLNHKMETARVELDEATYWTYASEKGTTIFCIYGIGDGTDNTPLYASGGATAVADAAKFKRFLEEFEHGSIEDRETLDRWSEALRRAERGVGGYLHDLAYGRADAGTVQVSGRAQRRAGRGASEPGKSNRTGEVTQKFSMETPVEQEGAQQLPGRDTSTARYSISGQKYWRPKLTKQEWSLLEGRLALEVESAENFLDSATKWLYATQQGVNVFCIYGIGDGTIPTPLYASGGKIAARENTYFINYLEGKNNGTDRTWTAFNRRITALFPGGVAAGRHLPQNGFPGETAGDGALHWSPQQRHGGAADGRRSPNRGGIERDSNRAGGVVTTPDTDIRYSLLRENERLEDMVDRLDQIRREGERAGKNQEEILTDLRAQVDFALEQLRAQYGTIPQGERPHRQANVPKRTGQNDRTSQTVRTVLEGKATPDAVVPTIREAIARGEFFYESFTDKMAIDRAADSISETGYEKALNHWVADVASGAVSKERTALGWALYNSAANSGHVEDAMLVLTHMIEHQRSAAQALQATRILKLSSPSAQLYAVQRSVENLQQELRERYGDRAPGLEISRDLAQQFLNAETPEEQARALERLYQDIGRQMPATFLDKWNAWRYLAMLGNPRTHIRNIVGNAFFAPVVGVKNLTATAMEAAVDRLAYRGTMERSKAPLTTSRADRALLRAAWNDYANVQQAIQGAGKYSDSARGERAIQEGKVVFRSRLLHFLEVLRKKNAALLDLEDAWFAQPHYAAALAGYLKANGITPGQLQRGQGVAQARAYAILEAQKATYRDVNAFSQLVADLGRYQGKNSAKKAASLAVEGILPFRQTPANILARGVEYSPAGLLKGLTADLNAVRSGKMQAYEAIDHISAGLTGTGLMMLGVLLAAQGLVRGMGGNDRDEREFEELMGHQPYALELPGGTSVTLDWMAPEALPFFVGVNLWEQSAAQNQKLTMSAALQAASHVTAPMLEMSCLQSLNDVFNSVGYASSQDLDALPAILASAATSYLTQGIPSLFGQLERTAQDKRMTTYTEQDAFLTGDMQYTLGASSGRIPGWDYQQIPYVDAWGRTEYTGSPAQRALNNFLNPAYTSTIQESGMEKELMRLYEQTGDGSLLPSRAPKYFTVDKERKNLTAEEYVQYASARGQTAYDLLMELAQERAYHDLSDTAKAELVKDVYSYADAAGKAAVSDYVPKGLDGELMALDAGGFDLADYLLLRAEGEAEGLSHLEIAVSAGDSALSTQLILNNYDAQRTAQAFTDPNKSGYEYQMDQGQQEQFTDLYEIAMEQALDKLFASSQYHSASPQARSDMVSDLQAQTNAQVKRDMARRLRAQGVRSVKKD